MNNKGQTLVLFVVMLPIILLGVCFFIDTGLIIYEQNRLEKLASEVVHYEEQLDDASKIETLIKKNDKNITIEVKDKTFLLEKNVKSIFGQVIGMKEYHLKVEKERIKKGE